MTELTAQLFEDAVEYLDEHGWTQHQGMDAQGRVCAWGAFVRLRIQGGGDKHRVRIFDACRQEICELMEISSALGGVPYWNDTQARSRDEVRDRLVLAAKKLRDLGR